MTEKEKMLAGEPYEAMTDELMAERNHARALLKKINIDQYDNPDARRETVGELLPNCPDDIYITPPFYCDYGYNIKAEEKVYMNFNCVFLDVCEIRIGARTLFAPNVQIYTAAHPISAKERAEEVEYGAPITIGKDCWIGGSAIVLPGVTIGDRVVVGAGSVVTKDVPSDCIVVGNPARIVKHLEESDAPE